MHIFYETYGMVGFPNHTNTHPAILIQRQWLEKKTDEELEILRIPRVGIQEVGENNGMTTYTREILPYDEGRTAQAFRAEIARLTITSARPNRDIFGVYLTEK